MERVLIHSAIGIFNEKSYNSILNLDTTGIEADILFTVYNPENPMYDDNGQETNNKWGVNVAYKMNKAREIVLKHNYDYLFNIEHDVIVPPDALKKLLKYADMDSCISGLYRCRKMRNLETPLCCKTKDRKWPEYEDIKDKEYVDLWIIAFGCILIGRNVLEKIQFDRSIDAAFANKTDELNIRKIVVPSVMCGHIDRDGKIYHPLEKEDEKINNVIE